MRVVLVGYMAALGGIRSHLRWLAKILTEAEHQTLVISTGIFQGQEQKQPLDIGDAKYFSLEAINPEHPNPLGIKLKQFQDLIKIVRDFEPELYFCVGTGWNLSLLPLALPKRVHSIFYEVMSGVPFGWGDARWGVRWWFNEVVGQSPTVANTFADCFGWKKPIPAIPAIPEPLELTACLPKPSLRKVEVGKARAALFSRLVPHKHGFWLVQQWDLLKDVLGELHIHGSGPEEPLIRDYIASRGIGERVKCFGRYPEGQAYVDLLSSYDLTLLPTIGAEGAPLVLLESMACGVPFVAYGVGGIPDYGVDNPNVLIVPPEPDTFISAIKQMLEKLAQGQIDQAELQQFYLNRYSYAVLKQAWLSYLTCLYLGRSHKFSIGDSGKYLL